MDGDFQQVTSSGAASRARQPSTHDATAHYRPDIDGLRAVAVLLVLLYHYQFPQLPGGFVGVDVFFVISGYLITRIIDAELASGRFSLLQFYNRRARRILPAAFAIYAATLAVGAAMLYAEELREASRALISSALFVSNQFFLQGSGYFDGRSETNPLLHTWSLSVEEQFYIVLPLSLMALRGVTRRVLTSVLAITAMLSLIAAQYWTARESPAAFYVMPLRAWELLSGSWLAVTGWQLRGRIAAQVGGLVGLALILLSGMLMRPAYFPGLGALPCVLGAVLLIATGAQQRTLAARLLSLRPVVFVGLISYSLYLWHWPLIVFWRLVEEPRGAIKLLAVAVAIGLATLSWRWIETPFRTGFRTTSPSRAVSWAGASILVLVIVTLGGVRLALHYRDEQPRIGAVLAYQDYDTHSAFRVGSCFMTSGDRPQDFDEARCLLRRPGQRSLLLLGDSHAAHLWPGLSQSLRDRDLLQANASVCLPVFGRDEGPVCAAMRHRFLEEYMPAHPVDTLLMSGRWRASDVDDVVATVRRLAPYAGSIVVVGPSPEYRSSLPRLIANQWRAGREASAQALEPYRLGERDEVDRKLQLALSTTAARYYSLTQALCRPDCPVLLEGQVPMLFDSNHFTREGSLLAASGIAASLQIPDEREH